NREARPGYASLPARSLGEAPHCFSMRLMPRLRARSDAYPGSRHTVLIAKSFYLHKLRVTNRDSEEACLHWSKSFFKFLPADLGWTVCATLAALLIAADPRIIPKTVQASLKRYKTHRADE